MSQTADGRPEPRSFLPLHPLEFRILLVLLDERAHGYRIVKRIEAREGHRTTLYPANLYRRIRRLLDDGLLAEAEPPAGESGADPRRTYYRLTWLGRAVARAEASRLHELVLDAREAELLEPVP